MEIYDTFILIGAIMGVLAFIYGNFHKRLRAIEREYERIDAFVKKNAMHLNELFSRCCFVIPSPSLEDAPVTLKSNSLSSCFGDLTAPLPSCRYFLSLCLRDGIDEWKGWGRTIRLLRAIRNFCLVLVLIAILTAGLEFVLADFPQQGGHQAFETAKLSVGIILMVSTALLCVSFFHCFALTNKRNASILSDKEE